MVGNKDSKVIKLRIIFKLLLVLEGIMLKRPMRKLNHSFNVFLTWKNAAHTRKTLLSIKHLILV